MHRPSLVSLRISPPDPNRGTRALQRGLHPRHPVRPRQDCALHCTNSRALHPYHPQNHAPWPLHAVGHFHMSGHAPHSFKAAGCDFNLPPFALVAQTHLNIFPSRAKRQAPSRLELHSRFQAALSVVQGQPHLKWHSPLLGTGRPQRRAEMRQASKNTHCPGLWLAAATCPLKPFEQMWPRTVLSGKTTAAHLECVGRHAPENPILVPLDIQPSRSITRLSFSYLATAATWLGPMDAPNVQSPPTHSLPARKRLMSRLPDGVNRLAAGSPGLPTCHSVPNVRPLGIVRPSPSQLWSPMVQRNPATAKDASSQVMGWAVVHVHLAQRCGLARRPSLLAPANGLTKTVASPKSIRLSSCPGDRATGSRPTVATKAVLRVILAWPGQAFNETGRLAAQGLP